MRFWMGMGLVLSAALAIGACASDASNTDTGSGATTTTHTGSGNHGNTGAGGGLGAMGGGGTGATGGGGAGATGGGGAGATGGGGAGATGGGGAGAGGGAATCDQGDCNACGQSNCAGSRCNAEVAACSNNADCLPLNGCINACNYDPTCVQGCHTQHANGVNDYYAMLNCLFCAADTCAQDCTGNCPMAAPPSGPCNSGDCNACGQSDCTYFWCGPALDGCFNDADCNAFMTCQNGCASDPTCILGCNTQHAAGSALYYTMLNCLYCDPTTCATDCAGQCPINPPAAGPCNSGDCNACGQSDCANFWCGVTADDCFNSQDCTDFLTCYQACSTPTCDYNCGQQYPAGQTLYYALLNCLYCDPSTCATDCQGFCPLQPQTNILPDGDPCTSDGECAGGFCLGEANYGFPGGMCTTPGCDQTPCTSPGTECFDLGSFFCLPTCNASADCRGGAAGYSCFPGSASFNMCWPGCTADAQCLTTPNCNQWTGLCEPDTVLALNGQACTTGAQCRSGMCWDEANDGFTGGYCYSYCALDIGVCPGDNRCSDVFGDPLVGGCLDGCVNNPQCRQAEGYTCINNPYGTGRICW